MWWRNYIFPCKSLWTYSTMIISYPYGINYKFIEGRMKQMIRNMWQPILCLGKENECWRQRPVGGSIEEIFLYMHSENKATLMYPANSISSRHRTHDSVSKSTLRSSEKMCKSILYFFTMQVCAFLGFPICLLPPPFVGGLGFPKKVTILKKSCPSVYYLFELILVINSSRWWTTL